MFEEYKNKIFAFYEGQKRMPSYKEIMNLLGFKSKNSVYKLVNKLIDLGFIDKDSTGKLIPKNLFQEVKLLGLVEAGIPTLAEEETLDTLNLDNYLIKDRDATYLLEVKGDSMIDEGIKEGDLVIAERKGEPRDGDIVIAEVDGGWTMKYFKKKGNLVYLMPANKNYKPIYPEEEMKVAAIVKGVIRKY
ncbi:MAG: transcriptional repressor LexA [bacterium]|nr:transcriptional repressor LexA [bacterium]